MTDSNRFAIGVDLGGTNMRIAAVDEHGKQIELITTSTEVKRGRDLVVGDICDAIRSLRKKFDGRGQFAGTGIGVTGMAGECGHITIFPDGVPCACGNRGCVEQYASATAVKRMAIEAIATGKAPELARAMNENLEFSAKVVFQHALQGDPSARHIFDVVGHALGLVL